MMIKDSSVMPFVENRRSNIVRQIDIINKLRKDAHAVAVTDDDMNAVRDAFDYLEAEFSPP